MLELGGQISGGCAKGSSAALPHRGAAQARGAGRALSGKGREITMTRAVEMMTRRSTRRKTSRRMKSSMTGMIMAMTDDEDD